MGSFSKRIIFCPGICRGSLSKEHGQMPGRLKKGFDGLKGRREVNVRSSAVKIEWPGMKLCSAVAWIRG